MTFTGKELMLLSKAVGHLQSANFGTFARENAECDSMKPRLNEAIQNLNDMDKPKVIFEVGNVYEMRYIGDNDLRPLWFCSKVTPKMATFEKYQNKKETITRKIKSSGGVDYVLEGNYSMAPSISANHIGL